MVGKKINRDFIKGGRGGEGSPFYEVISQKIFFFKIDGFPYDNFVCFSSFLIVKWNILLCSSIFHSSTQDKIPWFRLPTLSWTITSWQLLLPLQHMALSSSSPFSRRPSSFQSFYSYSTILFCPKYICYELFLPWKQCWLWSYCMNVFLQWGMLQKTFAVFQLRMKY